MTFAPPRILEVRHFLKGEDPDLSSSELGIVGGPSHIAQGTSYHLGEDQLIMSKNPYSARTARDRAGLTDAASALDIDDDLDELRELSSWLVEECRRGAPGTLDIREIIYTPDGKRVLRWDRERGINSEPFPDNDLSHLNHTHISWYRDSEFRDKVGVFKRFYDQNDGGEGMTTRLTKHPTTGQYLISDGPWSSTLTPSQADGWLKAPEPPVFDGTTSDPDTYGVDATKLAADLATVKADVEELKARPPVQSAPVDPAVLQAAITAAITDPVVLSAIAVAVADEDNRRSAE